MPGYIYIFFVNFVFYEIVFCQSHLSLSIIKLTTKNVNNKMDHCSICLEELSDSVTVIMKRKCGHWTFHKNCLDQWFLNSGTKMCPLCKQACPKEENKELTVIMAKQIHTKYWKDWGKLHMCCSKHILLSSGLTDTLKRNYHLYKKMLCDSAIHQRPMVFRRYQKNKEFICKINVVKVQKMLKIVCTQFFCKEKK